MGVLYGVLILFIHFVQTGTASVPNWMTVLMAAAGIVCLILNFRQSLRLSRAFGKGTGFGVGLFLLGPVFRLILGFGGARYAGRPEA